MSDPENTFRALKGEPLFVDRWQCRVGLHWWGAGVILRKKAAMYILDNIESVLTVAGPMLQKLTYPHNP